MARVASGEVEFGMTFLTGMTDPGIHIVGPFPREVSPPTIAAATYKAQKFQPGR